MPEPADRTTARRAGERFTVLIGLLLITGCVHTPRPVESVAPPQPALTVTAATMLVDHFRTVDLAARKHRSAAKLRTVLTGPALALERARIRYAEKSGGKPAGNQPPHDHHFRVFSTAAGSYPQLAMIIGSRQKDAAADSNYLAERQTASARWLISYVADGDLNTFLPQRTGAHRPTSSSSQIFAAVRPGVVINGIAPERITALVAAALRSPGGKQARRLVDNPDFHRAAATGSSDDHAEHQTRSYRYLPQRWQQAYRATDQSLIVFGGFTRKVRTRMDHNWWVELGGSDRKVLPGKYSSYTDTTQWQFVVRVPRHGKIALQSVESADADLTGKPFPA
jgi:hypothetical protein